jgi:hypothetical protein
MTDLRTNIEQLEALYEARHETDKLFSEKDVDLTLKCLIAMVGLVCSLESYFHCFKYSFLDQLLLLIAGAYLVILYKKLIYSSLHFSRVLVFYRSALGLLPELTKNNPLKNDLTLISIFTNSNTNADKWKQQHWLKEPSFYITFFLLSSLLLIAINIFSSGVEVTFLNICFKNIMLLVAFLTYFISSRYSSLDTLELGFSANLQKVLQIEDPPLVINCQPPNLLLDLVLTILTLGLNSIYVDYRLTVEAQKRFAESARVQGEILQALKQLAEESTELTEAIENA